MENKHIAMLKIKDNLKLSTMNNQIESLDTALTTRKLKEKHFSTKNFIKLEAWKKCIEIKSVFYVEIIPSIPKEKQESLGKLIRNAATSITTDFMPYNKKVSERYEKPDLKNDAQFIKAVRFSLSQLKNYITTCSDSNYINTDVYNKGTLLIENTKALLNRYIYYLSR